MGRITACMGRQNMASHTRLDFNNGLLRLYDGICENKWIFTIDSEAHSPPQRLLASLLVYVLLVYIRLYYQYTSSRGKEGKLFGKRDKWKLRGQTREHCDNIFVKSQCFL